MPDSDIDKSSNNELVVRLQDLLQKRWLEACLKIPELGRVPVAWEVGESEHFKQARGLATTKTDGSSFWLTFSVKLEGASDDRLDAIIRHELGHVIDYSGVPVPSGLPMTRELRADTIAQWIWGSEIRYDAEDVQTLGPGISPRPERLGL